MILLNRLSKQYKTDVTKRRVLNGIDACFSDTGFHVLLGKSGSGKSTLLNLLGGIVGEYEGTIDIDGKDVSGLTEQEWDRFRGSNFGIVFQDYNLMEEKRVSDNLRLPIKITDVSYDESEKMIDEALRKVGLLEYRNQVVSRLSGGQKQRAAVARAIIRKPKILLADEPTGNLDSGTASELFALLSELSKECLVIVATHDYENAYLYGDVVHRIEDGLISTELNRKNKIRTEIDADCGTLIEEGNREAVIESITQFIRSIISGLTMNSCETENVSVRMKLCESEPNDCQVRKERIPGTEIQPRALSVNDTIKMALENLLSKKKRSLMLFVLLAVAIVLELVAVHFVCYQPDGALTEYCKRYSPDYLTLYEKVEYETRFLNTVEARLSSGNVFLTHIEDIVGNKGIYPVLNDEYIRTDEGNYSGVKIVVTLRDDDSSSGPELLAGRDAEAEHELVITDYLASNMCLSVGDSVRVSSRNGEIICTVSGIVRTDYVEYDLERRINDGAFTEQTEYRLQNRYRLCFVSQSFVNQQCLDCRKLALTCSSVSAHANERLFFSEDAVYGDVRGVTEDNLLQGRLPEKKSEIVIDAQTAEAMTSLAGYAVGYSGQFIDINNQRYRDVYSNEMPMTDFFPEGFVIVGVYDGTYYDQELDGMVRCPSVLVSSEVFDEMKAAYFSRYCFGEFFIEATQVIQKTFGLLLQSGIKWSDPYAEQIVEFSSTINNLKVYFRLMAWMLVAAIVIICMLQIACSVKDQSRTIGIMRTVGFTRRDICGVFAVEAAVSGTIGVIVASVMFGLIHRMAEVRFESGIVDTPYRLLVISPWITLLVVILCIIISVLSGLIPVLRLSEKTPFELIHPNVD